MLAKEAYEFFYKTYGCDMYRINKWLYYAQGLSFILKKKSIFQEEFEAREKGPACILDKASDKPYLMNFSEEAVDSYSEDEVESKEDLALLKTTLSLYGHYTRNELIEKTHEEAPWIEAQRKKISEKLETSIISKESIRSYFKKLEEEDEDFSDLLWGTYQHYLVEEGVEETVPFSS